MLGGALEVRRGDRIVGVEAALAGYVEQDSPADQRRHRLDSQLPEANRRLHAFVDVHTAVQGEVLGLVRERVDVGSRVLGHDDDAGRAGAGFRGAARVMPVEEVVEAGRMSGMGRRTLVAELLEVEYAGCLDRLEQAPWAQSR